MENIHTVDLTKVPLGPILMSMVRAHREDRFSERKPIMKTLLRARSIAPNKNDYLSTPVSGGHGAPQRRIKQEQYRDGESVRGNHRARLAQVHGCGREQQTRDGDAYVVLRDGSTGTRRQDARTYSESNAGRGRHDRSGRSITPIEVIVRDALRAAVNAPSDKAALDVAGAALHTIAALSHSEVRRA